MFSYSDTKSFTMTKFALQILLKVHRWILFMWPQINLNLRYNGIKSILISYLNLRYNAVEIYSYKRKENILGFSAGIFS